MYLFIDGQAFFATAPESELWQEVKTLDSVSRAKAESLFLFRARRGREVEHWTRDVDGFRHPIASSYFGAARSVYGEEEKSNLVGFRPILYPLDREGRIEAGALADIPELTALELGGIAFLHRPVRIPEFPGELEYVKRTQAGYAAFAFSDTPTKRSHRMIFIKLGPRLVCDRALFTNVSPKELRQRNLMDEPPQ